MCVLVREECGIRPGGQLNESLPISQDNITRIDADQMMVGTNLQAWCTDRASEWYTLNIYYTKYDFSYFT